MKTLTLDEVKQAGRFAFQLTGGDEVPIYNPFTRELAEIVPWEGVERYGYSSGANSEPYTIRDIGNVVHGPGWSQDMPADSADDWRHLPGCDCEFCSEPAP